MNLLQVYEQNPLEFVKAEMCHVWDKAGQRYLDFYGGHAVISIGHQHPKWKQAITNQMDTIAYYSNAMQNSVQQAFAEKLAQDSGYPDYLFFACNSGAEANENALKAASFHTGRKSVLAFGKAFHGRTSGAVAVSDYPQNVSPFNGLHQVTFSAFNNTQMALNYIHTQNYAAVIIEGIQGVAGIHVPRPDFLQAIRKACSETGTVLILDEVQSGYGRTGSFFAHHHAQISADIVTMAKGMGNGFPVGGILLNPNIQLKMGQLGTTFGGNQLAMAAALSVLEVMQQEKLIENAKIVGNYLKKNLALQKNIKEVRGMGLMIALEFDFEVKALREKLLNEKKLVTGSAGKNTIRLLPPLCVGIHEANYVINAINDFM